MRLMLRKKKLFYLGDKHNPKNILLNTLLKFKPLKKCFIIFQKYFVMVICFLFET